MPLPTYAIINRLCDVKRGLNRIKLDYTPFLLVLGLMFGGVGCQQNSLDNIPLTDYFIPLSDFESPKVFVLKKRTPIEETTLYHRLEKIGDHRLQITEYTAQGEISTMLIDSFHQEGVTLTKMVHYVGPEIPVHIFLGHIFSFTTPRQTLRTHTAFTLPQTPHLTITDRAEWKLEERHDSNTLIARGSHQRIIQNSHTASADTLTTPMEIWYKKGIGIEKHRMILPEGPEEVIYSRTISLSEFHNLFSFKPLAP